MVAIIEEPHALVLERVEGQPLAQKPNLQVSASFSILSLKKSDATTGVTLTTNRQEMIVG